MSSMSTNTVSKSMNGLIIIDADTVNTSELDVDTLVINLSGTAPTIADPLDYSNNIATTEWVTNHAGVGYVTINTTQNITGEKTLSNANTIVSGNLITNSIRSSSGTTDINIGQNLTTGHINMGTTFIGPTMNVALNWGSSSNSGQLSLRGGSFTLASTGNYNQSSGATFQTNISTNQSTGALAIGTAGNRSGAIYINTGNTSTAPLFISSATNDNAPITIGSTASTTQTCDMNAITNFSKIPSCAVTATSANELVNLTTLNGAITTAGSNYVTLAGAQTITGDKTFTGQADFLSLNASYISNTSSIDTPSVTSGLQTDDLNIGANQTSGVLFLGCRTNRTGAINIGTLASGNAPIVVGSTSSTTQTATHNAITTFNKIPFCAGVPATGDHLTNKTYVDTVAGGGVNLGDYNVWTNENDFTNIVKIKDPTVSSTAGIDFFSSITAGIVMNGATGATAAFSGVNLNTNTLTVPINNNQSLVRVRIPMNLAGFGAPIFYFGQVDLIFNSITAITILKNGSFYKSISVFDLLNFTGTTKTWTGWSQKGENCRAYLGDVQFDIPITTANTSVDTYTIGITLDIVVNAAASLYITIRFLCSGDSNFTTTHATTTTGTTYISTDPPSFFAYQINFGNFGNYIIGTGDTYIRTIQGGRLNIETGSSIEFLSPSNFNTVLPQSTLTPNNNNDLATKLYIDNAIAQAITALTPATNPIGTIIMTASSTVPSGYLYCDGTTYNTTAYAGLWSVIFYTYGGSGSNFKVPDYRGCFIRGFGSSTVGGVTYTAPALGTVQQDQVLSANYSTQNGYHNLASGGTGKQCPSRARITTDPIDTGGILAQFARQGTENRPINQSVYYYIKY